MIVEVVDSLVPDIVFVARLGLLADPDLAPARPLYLKAPDAKPQDSTRIALSAT
jgi:tRNA threonylcarbamoyladenosine biosynthesis protein TsaB